MSRPPKCRRVEFIPELTYFKPAGVPLMELEEVSVTIEELEAIRLKDLEGLEQEASAIRMGVSRPTYHRVLTSARAKIAKALVEGKAIRVEGGHYKIVMKRFRCLSCKNEWEAVCRKDTGDSCPECSHSEIQRIGRDGKSYVCQWKEKKNMQNK